MFAALRGRGASAEGSRRRRLLESDSSSASSCRGAILDTDEQENVVLSLERQAIHASKTWRFAFGIAASLFSLFFARLASIATKNDRIETRDVAWSQPVHIHAYHENTSLALMKILDVATAAALLLAVTAMTRPFEHRKSSGREYTDAKHVVYAIAFVLGAFAASGWFRAFREAAATLEGETQYSFISDPQTAWVLAVAGGGAPACFFIDRSLERTVCEARALRRHMYRHKRA